MLQNKTLTLINLTPGLELWCYTSSSCNCLIQHQCIYYFSYLKQNNWSKTQVSTSLFDEDYCPEPQKQHWPQPEENRFTQSLPSSCRFTFHKPNYPASLDTSPSRKSTKSPIPNVHLVCMQKLKCLTTNFGGNNFRMTLKCSSLSDVSLLLNQAELRLYLHKVVLLQTWCEAAKWHLIFGLEGLTFFQNQNLIYCIEMKNTTRNMTRRTCRNM